MYDLPITIHITCKLIFCHFLQEFIYICPFVLSILHHKVSSQERGLHSPLDYCMLAWRWEKALVNLKCTRFKVHVQQEYKSLKIHMNFKVLSFSLNFKKNSLTEATANTVLSHRFIQCRISLWLKQKCDIGHRCLTVYWKIGS